MREPVNLADVTLIGVHGPLNGGKDTVCDYIIKNYQEYNFVQYSFALPIKRAAQVMFNFSDAQLTDRELKDECDAFWGFTPRNALQLLRTEYRRMMLREDVWIKRAELEIIKNKKRGQRTIISDVRFENEAAFIRDNGGILFYLEVPGLTRDFRYAHASERGVPFNRATDFKIVNDKTNGLVKLYNEIDKCIH